MSYTDDDDYQIMIGLEVHVQLNTHSKVFCGCSTRFGAEPNTQICPICLGLPGPLPVLNQRVVDLAIKTGLALNCTIASECSFDRKNYYYPDLPKGYQITQYYEPICRNGYLQLEDDLCQSFKVRITRIHIEEDAGKLVHGADSRSRASIAQANNALIDFNRAGVPLIEIVTEPDFQNPEQVGNFLTALKSILEYLEISDCNMEEGSLRVDANISLKPLGAFQLGIRTELKNMNSFKALERALDFEIQRQKMVLRNGGQVYQETRTWDEKSAQTIVMRGKEEAQDYRYFPEPDLLPLRITSQKVQQIQEMMAELPEVRCKRFLMEYGLPQYDAKILTSSKILADFFEAIAQKYHDPKIVANWLMGDLLRLTKEYATSLTELKFTAEQLIQLLNLIDQGVISNTQARTVFTEMFLTGEDSKTIVEDMGLAQISDRLELVVMINQVIKRNQSAVADYYGGKERAVKFLMGQVMKASQGQANPHIVKDVLINLLKENIPVDQ